MKFILNVFDGTGSRYLLTEGRASEVAITSRHLVSAGQQLTVPMTIQPAPKAEPGTRLAHNDARGVNACVDAFFMTAVDSGHSPRCWIPSQRSLSEILAEAVQHGVDNPRHGVGCSCTDEFVRELTRQIHKVIPWKNYDELTVDEQVADMRARQQVGVILQRVMGHLR